MDINDYFEAAYLDKADVLKKGVEGGLDPNLCHPDGGHTLLQSACQNDCVKSISVLLELGADPNKPITRRDIGGRVFERNTTAIASVKSKKAAKLLLDAGADINYVDDFGYTPLVWAVKKRSIEVIDFLCGNGSDPSMSLNIDGKIMTAIDFVEEDIQKHRKILGSDLSDKQVEFFEELENIKAKLCEAMSRNNLNSN